MKKYQLLVIIVVFCCNACNLAQEHKKEAERLNNKAIKLSSESFESTKLMKSVELLDSSIAIDSNYILAYSNKISVLYELKQYKNILTTIEKMAEHSTDMAYLFMVKGVAYLSLKQNQDAELSLKEAFKMASKMDTPQNKQMYFHLYAYFYGKQSSVTELSRALTAGKIIKKEYSSISETILYLDEDNILGID